MENVKVNPKSQGCESKRLELVSEQNSASVSLHFYSGYGKKKKKKIIMIWQRDGRLIVSVYNLQCVRRESNFLKVWAIFHQIQINTFTQGLFLYSYTLSAWLNLQFNCLHSHFCFFVWKPTKAGRSENGFQLKVFLRPTPRSQKHSHLKSKDKIIRGCFVEGRPFFKIRLKNSIMTKQLCVTSLIDSQFIFNTKVNTVVLCNPHNSCGRRAIFVICL